MINNLMPQNVEVEMNLLGCLINNSKKIDDISYILDATDFYLDKHKAIYKAILELNSKGIVDLITLTNYVKSKNIIEQCGGISYLSELATTALYSFNVIEYANIVKDKAKRRILINAARQMIEKSYGDTELENIVESIEDDLVIAASKNKDDDPVAISDAISNALLNIESTWKEGGRIQGVTTGFKEVDKVISGLKKGDFIILAARPSMGKTAFALNIGQCASKEGCVGIFSLEMSQEQLMNRLISARALVELGNIQNGSLKEDEFEKIALSANDLSSRKIFIDDKSMTISQIESKCKTLKRKSGLDVVIIDYLQLIEGTERNTSREQEVAKISRKLKKLAMSLDITIIALSQLSRAPEQRADHRPMLSDLRESGAIEQDADVIIFLYRDEYYNKESEDKNIAEVILGKNRNGEVKTIKLGWVGKYQRFSTLAWV